MGATSCRFKSCYPHQNKSDTFGVFVFVLAVIGSQNLPNATGVGSRQRLALCEANDGRCPSRQTCRFALRNLFNLSCYPHQQKRSFCSFLFLGFFLHFGLKKCLLKKLFPTLLTRFFRYVILTLQTKIQEHLNEKIYCSFALLDYVIINNFV